MTKMLRAKNEQLLYFFFNDDLEGPDTCAFFFSFPKTNK